MDASIPYADAGQAATARSCALRWLLSEHVLDDVAVTRQFGLTDEALDAVRDGAPLLVSSGRAAQIDRLVATQSLLLDGYTSPSMAAWFASPLPALDGKCAREVLDGTEDGTPLVLEAAAAWMA